MVRDMILNEKTIVTEFLAVCLTWVSCTPEPVDSGISRDNRGY